MSMRIVRNGDVHVSAPFGISKKEVEAFINEHQEWIVEARKKTAERQNQRAAFYNQLPLTTKAQKAEAMEKIRALTEPMISRWGMCNVKERSICYSTYLLLLPYWCVEHIVVHELCHLLEPSHNARFHALMDKYYPQWKEARRETRKIAKGERSCNVI